MDLDPADSHRKGGILSNEFMHIGLDIFLPMNLQKGKNGIIIAGREMFLIKFLNN